MKHAREDYNRIQDPAGLIPSDEPVFLLRGQDKFASKTLRYYASLVAEAGGSQDIVEATLGHADRMDEWPVSKSPDVPPHPSRKFAVPTGLRTTLEQVKEACAFDGPEAEKAFITMMKSFGLDPDFPFEEPLESAPEESLPEGVASIADAPIDGSFFQAGAPVNGYIRWDSTKERFVDVWGRALKTHPKVWFPS